MRIEKGSSHERVTNRREMKSVTVGNAVVANDEARLSATFGRHQELRSSIFYDFSSIYYV